VVGIHTRIGRAFSDNSDSVLSLVTDPLGRAACCHTRGLSTPAAGALDRRMKNLTEGRRFYFHIRNGCRYPDETGLVFPSSDEAIAHASVVAAELAQDEGWDGFQLPLRTSMGTRSRGYSFSGKLSSTARCEPAARY
jgi:hypothetical protein